ncbi:prepilin peptidase [Dissulfurirhabdus thermomarina]|uniref:Prepilin leader peptidase/N-methyltransferase n=1 Tax=Dissulfurirhabdus thermomarina TaxID=1765737 RepID=A0A6N9TS61_DISTH|nr:A24 family peptidase [Dissulfurirhabdus thermomarina]NDY42594.1 prepilin peptidase [Dissulfurirhabdus thermomarina]NMX24484.1 prepilin peptidase [Dissulfurirhabdus thermomarina]
MERAAPVLFAFAFGACLGSFANVCIHRLPAGASIVRPPSACPACGHAIAWWENVPLLSFVFLRGRCRGCGGRISWRYPAVEILCGVLGAALWLRFGPTPALAAYGLFCLGLVVVAFIDLEHRIIPDVVSLPGIAAGLLASPWLPGLSWIDAVLGALAGGGILYLVAWGYYLATGRLGMGGGDIKLLAMIGAFLGWQALPVVIFLSAAAGAVAGLAAMAARGGDRYMAIPYGPFLAAAAVVALFRGPELMAWYLGLLGG